MSEQPLDPYQINCYNRCTQMHGPLHHSDMTVSQALCKEDILQDDMVGDRGVSMLASSSSGKGDYTLHNTCCYDFLMIKTGSLWDGKFLYNNDCHKEEDFHINYHKKSVLYLSKPSFSLLQCAGQHMVSKQVLGKEGKRCQECTQSDD